METYDAAIARLAAEHLLERGFRHFAFCGDARFNWSRWREGHFRARIEAAGHALHRHEPPAGARDPAAETVALRRWLLELPKPVGILAAYDIRGQRVLDACRGAGLAIPDEVAVLGVDNDELLCELASPPLSSVMPNTLRTGYEAAALLDRMMRGEAVRPVAHLIPPVGLVARQPTDVLALEDRAVAQAVRFIREHACEGINVGDVLQGVTLSRRVLEQRFRRLLGGGRGRRSCRCGWRG